MDHVESIILEIGNNMMTAAFWKINLSVVDQMNLNGKEQRPETFIGANPKSPEQLFPSISQGHTSLRHTAFS